MNAKAGLTRRLEDRREWIEVVGLTGKGLRSRLYTTAKKRIAAATNLDEQRVKPGNTRSIHHLRDRCGTGQAGTLNPQRANFVARLRLRGLLRPPRLNGAGNNDENEESREATTRGEGERKQRGFCQTPRLYQSLRYVSNEAGAEFIIGIRVFPPVLKGTNLNPTHVVGLDVGSSKTQCFLADDKGQVIARAEGPGANIRVFGKFETEAVLRSVIESVAGIDPMPLAAICVGIAGADREEDTTVVRRIVRRIVQTDRILVVNDALIALEAGIGDAPGIVIIAGTGSIAYGRNQQNRAARAGGWGYVLGDEGSGYWLGRLALRSVVRASDGRGDKTALSALILNHFGLTRARELVREIYTRDLGPSQIAALAKYVQAAVEEGDLVARHILQAGARELVAAAGSVASQLSMTEESFTFVLSGGIFRAVPWLGQDLPKRLPVVAPASRTLLLEDEPALGAVRLALAEARGGARPPTYGE
jgi:N-acetylglucosamine kinase